MKIVSNGLHLLLLPHARSGLSAHGSNIGDGPMSTLSKLVRLCFTLAAVIALPVYASNVDEAPIGEAVERHLADDGPTMRWAQDPGDIDTEVGDTIETRETVEDALETVKLSGLVPDIRFETGVAQIPDTTVESLGAILARMKDRINVRLHLIGHADNRPLSPRLQAIYGDNAGLSRERAGQVAEHFQTSLVLPPEAISFEWAGDTQPVAPNTTEEGRALNRRVEIEVWYDEVVDKVAIEEFLVPHEIKRVKVCRMETVCKLRYVEGHSKRARVQNLVAPLRYDEDSIDVHAEFVAQVERALANLSDKHNVVVSFVGYTDAAPLAGRFERIYGDHVGLSKARARRVALAVQDSLDLPTAAIQSDGEGAVRPLASNATANGRALNRRVEVEFWYDDPLQELPDEPQLCPESAGASLVTRTYDPPWGEIAHIEFRDGQPVVPPGYGDDLARALEDVADKSNSRLRFVGYTRNERLSRRTAAVYGDDIGLSALRAGRHVPRCGPGRLRRARTSRRVRRRRYHARDARAQARESAQPEPDAHHRRWRTDRRSEAQLVRHPALHRRRNEERRHPLRLRQPALGAAAQRVGDAVPRGAVGGDALRTAAVAGRHFRGPPGNAGAFHDVHQLLALHRQGGSAHLRDRPVAGVGAARGRARGR
jgi:flagellar motor protein MotB